MGKPENSIGINDMLKKPTRYLKGVGEARAKLFHRLGIYFLEDLITYFPREYEDRRNLKGIIHLQDGETSAFEGTIVSEVSESRPRRGLTIYKVLVRDETGSIIATWYNQPYIKNVFRLEEKYMFYGKISRRFRSFEAQNPVYEKVSGGELKNTCRIVPVYPSTANLTQNVIRAAIKSALEILDGTLQDILPDKLRLKYNLSEYNYSVGNIHFPKSEIDFNNARYRLVFEELLLLQLGLLSIKSQLNENRNGNVFSPVEGIDGFIHSLPFKLTEAQERVFDEIQKDMESNKVMNRLVQGDVGSGKTVVAALAMYKASRNGFQSTLMVPTEILAEQHFETLKELFKSTDIGISLLTGSQTKKQKAEILEGIATGRINLVIGTHALIEENVVFSKLGLVVTDEQHRFGVRQRAALMQKGNNPDVLVMTATPIPRTLALILYGDLDISIIDKLPPGRRPVETYSVDGSMRERINNFIRKKVSEGRQVFIVCPLVSESDEIEAKSAVELAEKIAQKDFRDLNVGLIHGKMKARDKDAIMHGFVKGEVNILVSTTVIEVGVNVPNATLMVVENAERFGLAQLHQLRGRVGRGSHQSHCVLFNEGSTEVAKERMKIMQETNDGFIISEKDLELRGPGEFFGTRQHGIPDLKIANLYKDMEILKLAQEGAAEILKRDEQLNLPENHNLKLKIGERFSEKIKELSLN